MSPADLLGFLAKNRELKSFVPTKPLPSPWSKLLLIQVLVRKMKNIKVYNHYTSSVLAGNTLGLGSWIPLLSDPGTSSSAKFDPDQALVHKRISFYCDCKCAS